MQTGTSLEAIRTLDEIVEWHVFYGAAGREREAARRLAEGVGVECYVPMRRRRVGRRHRRDRARWRREAAFAGYLFARPFPGLAACRACGVVPLMLEGDEGAFPARLGESDIRTIRAREASGWYDDGARGVLLHPGDEARVAEGILAGLRGRVVRLEGASAALDLGGSVPVGVPVELLEVVRP